MRRIRVAEKIYELSRAVAAKESMLDFYIYILEKIRLGSGLY